MDESSPFRKRWLYITFWLALLLVLYGWQIARMGGIEASLLYIFVDLFCMFPILLIFWMAFFSQFVLPVHTAKDRQKIFYRLLIYLFGRHGPALFIENGEVKEHSGERLKKGPGVVWLDSASAAVTRSAVKIKQTLGPGVHFLNKGESISRTDTLDLHIQFQTVGPKESDKPFDEKKESQSDAEYDQIQERRKIVSALTRDGIEIVPNISVTFRANTGFPKEGQPGSRFGYRTGKTKKDKENEEKDKEAIYKAILGQKINPNVPSDSLRRHIAWNELPAILAVDVWREYVAKFTLDELFKQNQPVPPPPLPHPPQPTQEEVDSLSQPIQLGSTRNTMQDTLASLVHEINIFMSRTVKWLEEKKDDKTQNPSTPEPPALDLHERKESKTKTALQVINEMVKARLTQEDVGFLDDHGIRGHGTIFSPEFKILHDRGLEILNVNVSNIRFSDVIEKQIISQWKATWFKNAKAEEERINRQIGLAEIKGQEEAELRYVNALAVQIMNQRPKKDKDTLQSFLMETRLFLIRDDQLRRRTNTEREEIEQILQWMENGQ